MLDADATLLLVRPAARSAEFLALCEARAGRRIPAVISPVMRIVPEGAIPDLAAYRTVVLTSASAVGRLAEDSLLAGRRVATVGEATAALARRHGADAACLGEDVEDFLRGALPEAPAIHCRGAHTRGDLARRLGELGVPCDEAVIYDQVSEPLTPAARQLLGGNAPVILPLFSPRSAALASRASPITAPMIIPAISRATAQAWSGPGVIRVAEEPTAESMCSLTIDAL